MQSADTDGVLDCCPSAKRLIKIEGMQCLQAFKFELMPHGGQAQDMRRFAGARRFVFNKALDLQQKTYAAEKKQLSFAQLCQHLVAWKQELSWLQESPSQALQQSLKDLDQAWQNFFAKRAAFPKFKKKGQRESFRIPQGFKIDPPNSRLFLPKIGWIRFRNSRNILGMPKNITVSQTGDKWFASIQTEREIQAPTPAATTAIGIDVGIARFATMSDGRFVAPLCSFKRHEKRLAKYQRRMSRKTRFSKNWHKAKRKVQRIHTDIANARKDFLHKTTSAISKNHAMVAVEDLQIKNMSKSAAGSADKPGKNVAAKRGLNKAILDQGWFEFRRQLQYKLDWNDGLLIAVPPHHTSQTCPCCGHAAKENRKTQAQFECIDCGYKNHADVVGAMNILARGHRAAACGEDGAGLVRKRKAQPASAKQEPTEAALAQRNAGQSTVGIPSL